MPYRQKSKDITNRFEIYEDFNSCSTFPACGKIYGINLGFVGKIFNYRHDLKNSSYIHSHNTETPLTRPDVIMAVKAGIRKMRAVTPSGKYSSIEINPKLKSKIIGAVSVFDETFEKWNELSTKFGENFFHENKEAFNEYRECTMKAWEEFYKKTGVKLETNLQIL